MVINQNSKGKVHGIISNLVIVSVDGPIIQNEICYIIKEDIPLMAEVIKTSGQMAYVQVFENTTGLKIGAHVEFTGNMLEPTLGPGLLSSQYDGLLHDLKSMKGTFLQPGDYTSTVDLERFWNFSPTVDKGTLVRAGDWLGSVIENNVNHRIMVPFTLEGDYLLENIFPEGSYKVTDTIAILLDNHGKQTPVTMIQKWPVKKAIHVYTDKPRPFKIMETGIRVIDTFSPITLGGTGFIPGPFGSGKTVLQQSISKQAEADIVIVAACGERANEIVEIFAEFPQLDDPWTGRKLIERTIIIANTSNMPVAAREASMYSAMTLAEYYRSMGLNVLLLADSTSRWAQALREMSNRMEELPGPDAFPMDLPTIISNFYSRAGFVYLNNGQNGSITFIGTVSPAGGNLREPVTESTKKAARCFYALSQARADSKRYPAIDPIESYSKYLEYDECIATLNSTFSDDWLIKINLLKNMLRKGKDAADQINILGDDGVSIDTHVTFWQSETIDFVILQQDAFDDIDCRTPLERQKFMVNIVLESISKSLFFDSFEEVRPFFKKLINVFQQMNYREFMSDEFSNHMQELHDLIQHNTIHNPVNL
ncbi:MAG: V-type ATP synthase subunit A [Saprospiraceae bacterium]|nr:V-type ATP synthase subunit A [Saprospiraceae bacterium]